ncbi:TPA: hypothetical protein I7679_21850 [Vibrio vulnificus]|nr:hypothetical protein [Vibrio vulnificus]
MNVHIKTSQCSGVVNIHCLLCPNAMSCRAYLSDRYPALAVSQTSTLNNISLIEYSINDLKEVTLERSNDNKA